MGRCAATLFLALVGASSAPAAPNAAVVTAVESRFPAARPYFERSRGTRYEPAPLRGARTGLKPKTGYMGSAQSYDSLKPQEREALAALARRAGAPASFTLPRAYGTIAILKDGARIFLTPDPVQARPVKARVEDGALIYPGAYPEADAILAPAGGELEQMYYLRQRVPALSRGLIFFLEGNAKVSGFRLNKGKLAALGPGGAPLLELEPPTVLDARGRAAPARWELSRDGGRQRLTLSFSDAGLEYPLLIDPAWRAVGSMNTARVNHTATLLPNGKVLVAGGIGANFAKLSSAELYTPGKGTWQTVASMNKARASHTATLLGEGTVLVAGGDDFATAEVYNPNTNQWTPTNPMNDVRTEFSATLLFTGKVLVEGGFGTSTQLSSAEIYDPNTNSWSTTGSMSEARELYAASILTNGKVLVTGGDHDLQGGGGTTLDSAELYDPNAGTWSSAGVMVSSHSQHVSILLGNGKVLVAGGVGAPNGNSNFGPTEDAELYDPTSNSWAETGVMITSRSYPTATLLPNGKVLLTGGQNNSVNYISSTEIYDPGSGQWTAGPDISTGLVQHTATLLPSGKVLIAGGSTNGITADAEELDPGIGGWSATGNMTLARIGQTATFLPNGKVLVAGGNDNSAHLFSAELYDLKTGSWTDTGLMISSRSYATATLLLNGKVLVAGGSNGTPISLAELYDPDAGTWTATSSMTVARANYTATLLPNGEVLVAGGATAGSAATSTAELYNPDNGTWHATGSMHTARANHTATLLLNGNVLVAGGDLGTGGSSAEFYNSNTGSWTSVNSMSVGRIGQTATPLPSGKVLVAGGNASNANAELFDPVGGTWSSAGVMISSRQYAAASFLPDDKVLVMGGILGAGNILFQRSGTGGGTALSAAELYDPAYNAWSPASSLGHARYRFTATLLPNGRILAAGGSDNSNALSGAELASYTEYDYSAAALQPGITSLNGNSTQPISLSTGATVAVAGSNFFGFSEASGGNGSQNSPADAPHAFLLDPQSGNAVDVSASIYTHTLTNTNFSFDVSSTVMPGTYYFWTAANAVPSTFTIVNVGASNGGGSVPGIAGGIFTNGLGISSITWNWGAASGATGYNVYLASNTSSLLGTTSTTSFTQTTLSTNTLYGIVVAGTNGSGTGPLNSATTAYTLAAVPSNFASNFVSSSAVGVTWSTNTNPAGTQYQVQLSTGFGGAVTTVLTTSTFADFESLSSATSYVINLNAVNGGGIYTQPVSLTTTTLSGTGLPGQPGVPAGNQVFIASIAWNWNAAPGASSYNIYLATSPSTLIATSNTPFFFETNLSTNTAYGIVVAGVNGQGTGPLSQDATTYTLADAPQNFAPLSASSSTIALSWTAATNPAGTQYQVQLTTSDIGGTASTVLTTGTIASYGALNAGTSYYLALVALNGDQVPSGPPIRLSTMTSRVPPSSAVVAAVWASSIAVRYGLVGASQGYDVEATSDVVNGVFVTSSTLNPSVDELAPQGLTPNTTYFLRAGAFWGGGSAPLFTNADSTITFAAVPGAAGVNSVTAGAGSVTLNWSSGTAAEGYNPADTLYLAQISTMPSLNPIAASSQTYNLNAIFSGLRPATTYYAAVQAFNAANNPTLSRDLGSAVTPPGDAVTAAPFSLVTQSGLTANWNSNFPAGTTYHAQISTDNFATINASSATANLFATFSGLGLNVSYDARVSTDLAGPFTGLGSAATLAAAPFSPALSSVFASSLTFSWNAGGNPGYTLYTAQVSTDNFTTVNASSATLNANATFSSLTPNTTFFLRANAANLDGVQTGYTVVLSTLADAAAPNVLIPPQNGYSSMTADWTTSDPTGTLYLAQISTDNFVTVNLSSQTLNTSVTFGSGGAGPDLIPQTSYAIRVEAVGFNGKTTAFSQASRTTIGAPPTNPVLSAINASSITFSWSANGNPAGSKYAAGISTDDFATNNFSSTTANTLVTFGSGGAGAVLGGNTTYFLGVEGIYGGGSFTSPAPIVSTITPAAAPVSAEPSGVEASSLTVNWLANGNAVGTLYLAQVSTDAFASVNASSLTANTSALFSGLTANTSYDFHVRALSYDGQATAFTALPSTTTLLQPPAAAGAPFTAVELSSVAVAWAAGGNGPGTSYTAQVSTDDFATVNFSSTTLNLAVVFGAGGAGAALVPNTTYSFRVRSQSGGNDSAFLSIGSTATLAAVPAAPVVTNVLFSSAAIQWSANGNPAGTLYAAQVSTDDFATLSASSLTLNAAADFLGLASNTTYYLRVAADGLNRQSSFTQALSTITYAQPPVGLLPTASDIAVSSIVIRWIARNPSGTTFIAQVSTDDFASVNFTSSTLNTTVPFGAAGAGDALTPNTTYYFRVAALGFNGVLSNPETYAPYPTLAAAPASPALSAVSVSSLTFAWNAAGNPADTAYLAQISTDSFSTINRTSATDNVAVLFGPGGAGAALASNATYYLRVQAVNRVGLQTDFTTALSTVTPTAAPAAAAPSNLGAFSATANWLSNGNAAGTLYLAQISTDAFASVNASSLTANTAAAFSSLAANTAYDFRVRAIGYDGQATAFTALPSTTTLLQPPAAAANPFTAVELSSVAVAWAAGGNGPGTFYTAQISTDNFATVNFSSTTLNLAALFGAGGAGASLVPGTTYYFQVRSQSGGNNSGFLNIGSTWTLAAVPANTAVVGVSSTAVSVSWNANANPAGTGYELWQDASAAFTNPVKTTLATTTYQAAGLTPNSTYYFKVRAFNPGLIPSSFDLAVSTLTLPPAPGQPGTPAGAALGVSSISWTWSGAANASSYKVYLATNTASLLASVPGAAFNETALATNTAYGIAVTGLNAGGVGPLSSPATTYTLAAPPAQSAVSAVTAASATLSWSLNSNPAQTTAQVQKSTDGVNFSSILTAQATYFLDSNLLGCTTYYYRVRNFNGDDLATPFDATVQFITLNSTPAAPSSLSASAAGNNRIALSWTASPTEGVTGYRLYFDNGTGAVSYAAPLAVLTSTETSFTTGVLASSAAYTFALRAVHRCGVEETTGVFAAAASTGTLPALRAAILTPDSGRHVTGDRLSVAAGLTAGTIDQVRRILFQFKPSSAAVWGDIAAADPDHPNPSLNAPFYVHWDVTGLAAGSYDLRAVAYSVSGGTDTIPDVATVQVDPLNPDITENLIGGKISRVNRLNTSVVNTLYGGGSGASDPLIKIVIPASALAGSTVDATIEAAPALSTSPPAGLSLLGNLTLRVTLGNGQSRLLGGGTARLSFFFPSALAGSNPKIYVLNELTGQWTQDFASTADSASQSITGDTPHFSYFAVLVGGQAASNLSGVRVYPIPYKPNGGNPDEGKPYVSGDTNSGIIFDHLPASASIKIYTLSGRKVAEFDASSSGGKIQWDARNSDGRDVATGGYLAVISSPGNGSVVKKLLIIR